MYFSKWEKKSWILFSLLTAKKILKKAQKTKSPKGNNRGVFNENLVFLKSSKTSTIKTDRKKHISLIDVVCGKGLKKINIPSKIGMLWFRDSNSLKSIFNFANCGFNELLNILNTKSFP